MLLYLAGKVKMIKPCINFKAWPFLALRGLLKQLSANARDEEPRQPFPLQPSNVSPPFLAVARAFPSNLGTPRSSSHFVPPINLTLARSACSLLTSTLPYFGRILSVVRCLLRTDLACFSFHAFLISALRFPSGSRVGTQFTLSFKVPFSKTSSTTFHVTAVTLAYTVAAYTES